MAQWMRKMTSVVNEAHFYLAPMLCGDATTASLARPLKSSVHLSDVDTQTIGDNVKVWGYVK